MNNLSIAKNNLIHWPVTRKILSPGTQIDVQLNDSVMPLSYTVLMTLSHPLIFCRSVEDVIMSMVEDDTIVTVFAPIARGLCSLKMVVRHYAEEGRYLALSPTTQARVLKHRKSVRVVSPEDVSYRVQFGGKINIYRGITPIDLSDCGIGMLVYAANPMPQGSHAKIEIGLPEVKNLILTEGMVAHCTPCEDRTKLYRVGIKFTSIDPDDKKTIAAYVEDQLSK